MKFTIIFVCVLTTFLSRCPSSYGTVHQNQRAEVAEEVIPTVVEEAEFVAEEATGATEEELAEKKITGTLDSADSGHCYSSRSEYHRDCQEIFENCQQLSGVYSIQPDDAPEPFKVYCNNSVDGGGWTVLQRRVDGSIDFYRIWAEYKKGFGFLGGEFWLGNDKMSFLTNQKDYELRIDMNNVNGDPYFVKYTFFRVSDEWSKYNMTLGDYMPESNAERDSLSFHKNMGFTTHDNDNDLNGGNCAVYHGSAWWYNSCDYSDFNANYFAVVGSDASIEWTGLPGGSYNLKFVEMKVRPL